MGMASIVCSMGLITILGINLVDLCYPQQHARHHVSDQAHRLMVYLNISDSKSDSNSVLFVSQENNDQDILF